MILRCVDCDYYDRFDETTGRCRKDPAQFMQMGEGGCDGYGYWPEVDYNDWCGEHSQAPNITNLLQKLCTLMCTEDVSGGG